MISAVQWVRRGVARREPLRYELTPEELEALQASVRAEAEFHGAAPSDDDEDEDDSDVGEGEGAAGGAAPVGEEPVWEDDDDDEEGAADDNDDDAMEEDGPSQPAALPRAKYVRLGRVRGGRGGGSLF
jgi:hypothetical protein